MGKVVVPGTSKLTGEEMKGGGWQDREVRKDLKSFYEVRSSSIYKTVHRV